MQQGLFELVTTDITAVQDQLRVIEARLADAHGEAAMLGRRGRVEREEARNSRPRPKQPTRPKPKCSARCRERLDRRLAEAEALAEVDRELSEEIRRGEEVIARRLAVARAKAAEAAEQAAPQASDSGNEGESGSGLDSAAERIARPDDIVNVRGINVHHSIADQLLELINAAEAAGFASGRRRLEKHRTPDRSAHPELRIERLPHLRCAVRGLFAPNGSPGELEPRSWPGSRLHQRRSGDHRSQLLGVLVAGRERTALRLLQPVVRAMALEHRRDLRRVCHRFGPAGSCAHCPASPQAHLRSWRSAPGRSGPPKPSAGASPIIRLGPWAYLPLLALRAGPLGPIARGARRAGYAAHGVRHWLCLTRGRRRPLNGWRAPRAGLRGLNGPRRE